jgi:hypothetical protein
MPTLRIEPSPSLTTALTATHARSTRPAIASCRDACSGANGSLAAGDGPAKVLASREFDACLRVSESAAVRCCEPAAVTGNGLSSLATADWVFGTEGVLECGECPFVLLIRQQTFGSDGQRKLKAAKS